MMKKNEDKISQAYYYKLGKDFGKKVRARIHWILENAKGEHILDVGCSQGLVSILLAREGKNVTGIDILKESIEYANAQLLEEEEPTKRHVKFIHDNFIDHTFTKKFDVIIMGEFLEHISDTGRFIKKALDLLNDNGKLIITVPFGINDYFDHKHTYYLSSLLEFSKNGVFIEQLRFLGKWVGIVGSKRKESLNEPKITLDLLKDLERNFNVIEDEYISNILKYKNKVNDFEKKYSGLENTNKKQLRNFAEAEAKIKELNVEIVELKRELEEEKKQNLLQKRQRVEQLEKEEKILKDLLNTKHKYESLSKSKLGRMTIKYWNWRNKRR